jgi:ribosomal protein S18 acetylase RimI-like enzyme
MDEVTFRRAVSADLAAVVALLEDVDRLHREALPWLFRRVEGTALVDFLEPYVSQSDRVMFLACAAERSLAGVLYMFLRQPARAPVVEPAIVAEIDSLVVHPALRRQRVATRLVDAALRWAQDSGATRTELGVYEFNETARAFWQSVGFGTLSRRLVLHAKPEAERLVPAHPSSAAATPPPRGS